MDVKRQGGGGNYYRFLACLGVACPLLLSPTLFLGNKESRCRFCMLTVSVLQLTETLPSPVVALLPLFIFADLEATPSANIELTASLLVVMVDMIMVRVLGCTSVIQRLSLFLLEGFGTRLRSVALLCMSVAVVLPLAVHDTLAVLLVLALVRRLVFEFMNDDVQLPALAGQQPAEDEIIATAAMHWLPMASTNNAAGHAADSAGPSHDTSQHLCIAPNASETEASTKKQDQLTAEPRRSSLSSSSHKSSKKGSKRTSLVVEGGKVVLPGVSSPTPKASVLRVDSISGFHSPTRRPMKKSPDWKYQKLCLIHAQLATAAVLTCTLASAMSLNHNRASVYFTEYFRVRFSAEATSTLVWTATLLPMEYVSCLLAWVHIRSSVLRHFDVQVSKNTAASIQMYLQRKRQDMGTIGAMECLLVLLFCSWIVVLAFAERPAGVKTSVDDLQPLGVLCLVIAYAVPWSLHGNLASVGGLARSLPWGVIITVAGSGSISLVVKGSGFGQWLAAQLHASAVSKFVKQCILAVSASIVTELVSNASALSLLLPVAVDAALITPCNPLYFAIPVTVAASTSLVLPTSGVGIAVLCNMIDVGPVQLLLNGLTVKFMALLLILVTVNLNSDLHRLPDWMFGGNHNYTVAFAY